MCGIAGLWNGRPTELSRLDDHVRLMTGALRHRGPDDNGTWTDGASRVGLGHTRLSILDLSPLGHQPMLSSCGRHVVVFNGEIYNFMEIRRDLEALGRRFQSHSDTEVLVEGVSQWGARQLLPRLNGMFAFAIWDKVDHTLLLARDRQGIKPLYYGWHGGAFIFGSELKALTAFPGFERKLNRSAVGSLLRYNYVPAPDSIWQGVHKLRAGEMLTLREAGTPVAAQPYWRIDDHLLDDAHRGPRNPAEMLDQLGRLLADAVKQQMVADVPLGAFLSGGIDSSLVVALMQSQSASRVRTFTIGFEEAQFDESRMAGEVARVLGTDHTEMRITPQDALDLIPQLSRVYDEPFADASQIPTCLLARLTRQHVKVSLSGDGGDELFAGYSHYFTMRRRWRRFAMIPRPLRQALAASLTSRDGSQAMLGRLFGGYAKADKLRKLAQLLRASNVGEFYQNAVARRVLPDPLLPGIVDSTPFPVQPAKVPDFWDPIDRMVYCDLHHYLPEDILTKVDRATMMVALEARVPLLDHRVVEFATRVPLAWKTLDGRGKWPLRQLLGRHIPRKLIDRPKMGFRVPLADWLRGPLRGWVEDLLSPQSVTDGGIFALEPLHRLWRDHQEGVRDCSNEMWSILMFQAWAREWKPRV